MPTLEQVKAITTLERLATSPDGRRWIPGRSLEDLKLLLLELLPEIKEKLLKPALPSVRDDLAKKREALQDMRRAAISAMRKTCPHCGETKSGDEYHVRDPNDMNKPVRLVSWCKDCCRDRSKRQYAEARRNLLGK